MNATKNPRPEGQSMARAARFWGVSLAAVGYALGLSGAAFAQSPQEAKAPAAGNGEEIIITATKRGQRFVEAPVSVSVVSEQTIRNTGATNFSELATLMPSVVFSQQQSAVQSNVGIRGVTTAGGSAALEPSVGIYVDGVFTDRTYIGIGDFNDIAAVEVLRGPQSTLFGNASPAGIINFVTKAPERTFGGEVRASLGNYNTQLLSATVTGPLLEDALLGRLSYFRNTRDGYLDNLVGKDSNDNDSWGVRGRVLIAPDSPLRLTVTGEYSISRQNCCVPQYDNVAQPLRDRFAIAAQQHPFRGTGVPFPNNNLDAMEVAADGDNFTKIENTMFSFDLRWDVAGHEVTSITALRGNDQFSIADIDFTGLNLLTFPRVTRNTDYISQEVRITSPEDQPFTYLLGGYFFQKNVQEISGLVINPATAGIGGGNILAQFSPSFSNIENKNYALFGEGTLKLSDRFSLTGGLRYNFDDKFIEAQAERLRANGTSLSPIQRIPLPFQNRDGGEWTYRGVAQFAVTPDWNLFASYTRGYKAFGINDDANLLRNVPGASFFFDSEIVDNYEIGTKGFFAPLNTTFNVVAFNTAYKDFQSLSSFTDTNNQLRFFLQNAASLTSRGVELDLNAALTDNFSLNAAVTYLDSQFDDFPNAEGPSGPVRLTDRPLRDAPMWSGSLVARYNQPISDKLRIFAQGDMFYRSKVFTDQNLDPLQVQGDYTKYNARIGIGRIEDGWSLELWGRNLTNEITFGRAGAPVFGAVTGVLPLAGQPSFPVGAARIKFTSEPRTYGVSLGYRF